MHFFPNLEPVLCSTSSSKCCFLTWMQVSQEADKVLWYSHLLKNFLVCCDPHSNWRRKWQPTAVLLLGEFHGWRSLVAYSPWSRKESDTTEQLHFLSIVPFEEGNGNPLQCSCLENPMYRAAWWAAVYGVAKSWTWLSNSHTHTHTHTHRNFPNKHWSLLSCIGSTS